MKEIVQYLIENYNKFYYTLKIKILYKILNTVKYSTNDYHVAIN